MRYISDIPRDSKLSLLAAPAMAIEDIFHDAKRNVHAGCCKKSASKHMLGVGTCITYCCTLGNHELDYVCVTINTCI
jgi:hypothetical protein